MDKAAKYKSWSSSRGLSDPLVTMQTTSCLIRGSPALRSSLPSKTSGWIPLPWPGRVSVYTMSTMENGSPLNKILSICKECHGRSKYLLSLNVMVCKDRKIPAKIVCVRNKKNKKDWIAFICTNPALSEEEIIRVYGKRWQVEVFFKTCKSYLQLVSECYSRSFEALTAHIAIVFTRYLWLRWGSGDVRMTARMSRYSFFYRRTGGYHIRGILPDHYGGSDRECMRHFPANGQSVSHVHRDVRRPSPRIYP